MRRQQDPPDHTRLRSLVNKAFTRQAVNLLEPRIRGLMAALLDDIDDPAGFDLMKAVANPLPVTVIAEMLGVAAGRPRPIHGLVDHQGSARRPARPPQIIFFPFCETA